MKHTAASQRLNCKPVNKEQAQNGSGGIYSRHYFGSTKNTNTAKGQGQKV